MVCECPPEYFCGTDGQGKRLDYHQRPELSQGSVEFIAPQEYMVTTQPLPVLCLGICVFCKDHCRRVVTGPGMHNRTAVTGPGMPLLCVNQTVGKDLGSSQQACYHY